MPDALRTAAAGPDAMWSTDLPPSRGQYQTIAVLALKLLGVEEPAHRLDASVAITRLQNALLSPDAPPVALPAPEAF